ncbi:hypothetical protein EDC04DRAFT_3012232 [Pisolithus marmoratus]|nr:hypothetical protein EDC04DRAFT_3012232 [Pisolithus marmoratus]
MAQNKLLEQLKSRADKPLECEQPKALNGMVKVPVGVNKMAELASEPAEHASRVDESNEMAHRDLPSKPCNRSMMNDLPGAQRLPFKGEQAVCTSGSIKDAPMAPARCEDSPQEQSKLVDVNHSNHRCGTSMDTIADEAEIPSMPNDAKMVSTELEEVSNKSHRVSNMVAVEGSLGVKATDIATSMEIMTQIMHLN